MCFDYFDNSVPSVPHHHTLMILVKDDGSCSHVYLDIPLLKKAAVMGSTRNTLLRFSSGLNGIICLYALLVSIL